MGHPAAPRQDGSVQAEWDAVRTAARGERTDYALDHVPLDATGGQGTVFAARHKATDTGVAFKRVRSGTPASLARMNREIAIGRAFEGEKYVMPVLDADPVGRWFVMPLAKGNAIDDRDRLARESERLRRLVTSVANGLRPAHERGWIHRDVKPANVLRLRTDSGNRWVVADWGLVRRPRGQTSEPNRTRTGRLYGTEGFAAPELSVDAHNATPAADIYSIGQLIGWALTRSDPQANVPLLPAAGPWRVVVGEATRLEPARRPQTVDDLLALVADELDEPEEDAFALAERLASDAQSGDPSAGARLFELCHSQGSGSHDVHVDVLPHLPSSAVRVAVRDVPEAVLAAVRTLQDPRDIEWGDRSFKWADQVILLLLHIAEAAADAATLELLAEAGEALFAWDGRWDQWDPQPRIRRWLSSLTDDTARVVARALRRHPDSARHFRDVADNRNADPRIRAAVRSST